MSRAGVTVKDVAADEFIQAFANHLKRSGKVDPPKWVDIVKTGTNKELAPYNPDWYFIRVASVARKVYLRGGIGVGSFRKIYGGRKRNGTKPSHFVRGSGSIARSALKTLTVLKVVELDPKGGRRISQTGQRDLDRIAGRIASSRMAKT